MARYKIAIENWEKNNCEIKVAITFGGNTLPYFTHEMPNMPNIYYKYIFLQPKSLQKCFFFFLYYNFPGGLEGSIISANGI